MHPSPPAPRGYQHFEGRGRAFAFASGPRGRLLLAAVVAGGLSYYLYCLETVPYTGRRHAIMLVSNASEQWMGRRLFEDVGGGRAVGGGGGGGGGWGKSLVVGILQRCAVVGGRGGRQAEATGP